MSASHRRSVYSEPREMPVDDGWFGIGPPPTLTEINVLAVDIVESSLTPLERIAAALERIAAAIE